jgi:hypothetical protein
MGIEITIRAFAQAKRPVNIKGEALHPACIQLRCPGDQISWRAIV